MATTNSAETKQSRARHLFFRVWSIIGIVLILIGCGYALGFVGTSIAIILFSAFLVFILRIPVAWMAKKRIPRALGSILAYLAALVIIAAVLLIIMPFLVKQFADFFSLVPGYVASASAAWEDFYANYYEILQGSSIQQLVTIVGTEFSNLLTTLASSATTWIVSAGTAVVGSLIVVFVSLIVGYWVLKDLPKISREVLVIIGPRYREDMQFVARSCAKAFTGYLKGMTISGFCVGTLAGISYYFIGLPYPVALGVLTGILNFIPILGPWVAGIIVALLALFISPLAALLAIVLTIIAQQITDNFVYPRVMADAVELHPSVVIVMLFAGAALGGILGMVCAIPLTAVAKSIFVYYFERKTGRQILSLRGALFKGKPAEPDSSKPPDGENASKSISEADETGEELSANPPDELPEEFSEQKIIQKAAQGIVKKLSKSRKTPEDD